MNFDEDGELAEGIRLLQSGDNAGAANRFTRITEMNPVNGAAFAYLGVAQSRIGYFDAAVASMQEAARLKPGDPGAQYNLAIALRQLNRFEEARIALERALAMDSNHEHARAALATLPTATTQFPEAVSEPIVVPAAAPPPGLPPLPQAPPDLAGFPPTAYPAYNEPVRTPGMALPPAQSMQGMVIPQQSIAPQKVGYAPSSSVRILRGLGWGALYGQWWTLLNVFWGLVYSKGDTGGLGAIVFLVFVFGIFFAVIGSLIGLIIGAANLKPDAAAIVGVVCGLILMGLEYWYSGSAGSFVNIFFWIFTGRFIGAGIALRVQRPVLS